MRTPAGSECRYFYGNYYRGRNTEECRLLVRDWKPELCKTCPVPGILRANSCPNLVLEGEVKRGFLGIGRHVKVTATCTKTLQPVAEPQIGCGQCHPLPPIFTEKS